MVSTMDTAVTARQNFSHSFSLFYSPSDFEYFRDTFSTNKKLWKNSYKCVYQLCFPFPWVTPSPHPTGVSNDPQQQLFCSQGKHFRDSPGKWINLTTHFRNATKFVTPEQSLVILLIFLPVQRIVLTPTRHWRCF